jgi:hypothetical protein
VKPPGVGDGMKETAGGRRILRHDGHDLCLQGGRQCQCNRLPPQTGRQRRRFSMRGRLAGGSEGESRACQGRVVGRDLISKMGAVMLALRQR